MKDFKISILGAEWSVFFRNKVEDKMLETCDGYTDWTNKTIVVISQSDNEIDCVKNFEELKKKTARHEIIHAFLFESGIGSNLEHKDFGHEETMVDWLAFQFPKMQKIFAECGLL